jgi:hypothetical protein
MAHGALWRPSKDCRKLQIIMGRAGAHKCQGYERQRVPHAHYGPPCKWPNARVERPRDELGCPPEEHIGVPR